jgi:hypothetical protein
LDILYSHAGVVVLVGCSQWWCLLLEQKTSFSLNPLPSLCHLLFPMTIFIQFLAYSNFLPEYFSVVFQA